MKRILALSLMLILVLSMGVFANTQEVANEQAKIGALKDEPFEIEAEVSVTIEQYARVWLRENNLFKKAILGQPGLYTSDEDQVIELAQAYFDLEARDEYWQEYAGAQWMGLNYKPTTNFDDPGYDREGGALFRVESNCDANVDVAFAWDNTEKKLNSEMVFWVFEHEGSPWSPVNGYANDPKALNSMLSTNEEKEHKLVTFTHNYANNRLGLEYKIGGALFIDYISQQAADTYEGVITITLSALAE